MEKPAKKWCWMTVCAVGGREGFVDALGLRPSQCVRAGCGLCRPREKVFNVAPGTLFSLGEFIEVVTRVHPRLQAEWPADITTGFAGFAHPRPAPSSVVAASRHPQLQLTSPSNKMTGYRI